MVNIDNHLIPRKINIDILKDSINIYHKYKGLWVLTKTFWIVISKYVNPLIKENKGYTCSLSIAHWLTVLINSICKRIRSPTEQSTRNTTSSTTTSITHGLLVETLKTLFKKMIFSWFHFFVYIQAISRYFSCTQPMSTVKG